MTDDPRVGGLAGDEPVHEDQERDTADEAHDLERNTAAGWRKVSEPAEPAAEEVAEGLERAEEQPGYGREGS